MEQRWTAEEREKYIRSQAAGWVAALHPRLHGTHAEIDALRHKGSVSEVKTTLREGGARYGLVVCFEDPTGAPLQHPQPVKALCHNPVAGKWQPLSLSAFPADEAPASPRSPSQYSIPIAGKLGLGAGTAIAWALIVLGLFAIFPDLRDIAAGLRSHNWEIAELVREKREWSFVDPADGRKIEIENLRFTVARERSWDDGFAAIFRIPAGWWEEHKGPVLVRIDRLDLHDPVLVTGIPPESSGFLIFSSTLLIIGLRIWLDLRRGRQAGLSSVGEALLGSGKFPPLLAIILTHTLFFALYIAAAFLWCNLVLLPLPGWPALLWLGILAAFELVPGLWTWAYSYGWFRWFLLQVLIVLTLPLATALLGLTLPFLLAGLTAILLLVALFSVFVPKYFPQNVVRLVWIPLFLAGTAAPFRSLCLLGYQLIPGIPYHAPADILGNATWVARFDLAVGVAGIAVILTATLLDTFWRLRQARQVENLPTSKTRSAALGIGEFRGRARRLDGKDGEILSSTGDGLELLAPFYLEDDTGRILVNPRGAKFRRGRASSYGGRILEIVLSKRVTRPEIARPMSMRLLAGDAVYIIGNVMPNPEASSAVGSDALVVKPLLETGVANSFASLFLGKTGIPPARDIQHVFFLADSGEARARRWIMRGVADIWGKAIIAVALCFFLISQQLPRATGGKGNWTFAETLAAIPFDAAIVDYLVGCLLQEGEAYRHSRELWLNDFSFTRKLFRVKERQEREAALAYLWSNVRSPAYREAAPALARLLEKSGEPEVRRYAVWALGKVQAPPELALPLLLAALQEAEPEMRIAAAQSLAEIVPEARPEVVAALLVAAGDTDPAVARIALWSLRETKGIPPAEALPVLIPLLAHDDGYVRHEAANVLAKLDAAALPALEPLRKAMADPEYIVVNSAVVAVGGIGPAAAAAVPELIGLLGSTTYGTRQFAATALGEIGPSAREALPVLQSLLEDRDEWVRKEAERAIRKIGSGD